VQNVSCRLLPLFCYTFRLKSTVTGIVLRPSLANKLGQQFLWQRHARICTHVDDVTAICSTLKLFECWTQRSSHRYAVRTQAIQTISHLQFTVDYTVSCRSSYERRLARNCICYGLVCLVVTLTPEPVSFVHHARQSPPQTFAICQWPLTTRWVQRRNRCDLAYVGAADRYVTALRCHWEPPRKCTFVLPVSHDGKTGSSRAQSFK